MREKFIEYRNNVHTIQSYAKILDKSRADIELLIEKSGKNKKENFKGFLLADPLVFNNYTIVNFYKKLEKKDWSADQLIFFYTLIKNERYLDIINNYIKITNSIQKDIEESPVKLDYLHNFFLNMNRNFRSRYYSPHRWSIDHEFVEEIYKLLAYHENYDRSLNLNDII